MSDDRKPIPIEGPWSASLARRLGGKLSKNTKILPEDRYKVAVSILPREVRTITSIDQLDELSDWLKEHQQDEIYVQVHAKVSDYLPLSYVIDWTKDAFDVCYNRRSGSCPFLDIAAEIESRADLCISLEIYALESGVRVIQDGCKWDEPRKSDKEYQRKDWR